MYTLVIVDDEPAIAEGICRLLDWKSLGFERIRTARSCFEVVSHVVDWKPDVCLVDVRIGNEFGYELINCLNGMGVKSNYIMMSGYDDFQYACEALRCGIAISPAYLSAQLAGGGLMLGAFFMATDYVTRPVTKKGQYIYGVILGFLTAIFRIFGASAEGVSYAIILGNLLVPLIERYTMPKAFGKGGERS